MPMNTILLALAAGLISAIVFVSATTGPMLVKFVLFFLTPLTLYLAGLGLGPTGAAIAALSGSAIILLISNPVAAMLYGVSAGLPAFVTTRLALLGRDDNGHMEWFPIGRIVMTAALIGAAFATFGLLMMGNDLETLSKTMRTFVETFVKTELPAMPGRPAITEAQIEEISSNAVRMMPASLAVLATSTILFNLWLAGRITLASGRLPRPWPDLSQITLPGAATFVLLSAIAATLAGGGLGLFAGTFAGAFTFAFALVGLAVVHVLSRGSPWRNFALSALYAALLVFTPSTALILALGGLAETIFHYRAANDRGPPSQST